MAKHQEHKLGDVHLIEGIECAVKFVNAGIGFLFPVEDHEEHLLILRHICFAKIFPDGSWKKL